MIAFDFIYEIVQIKIKKLEINLNIEFEGAVLSTIFVRRKKYYGTTYVIYAWKGGTEIIPLNLIELNFFILS